MSDIHQYEPLWGSWYVENLIGEGSFGKVYRIRKEEFGKAYFSALKVLSIPQNDAEIRQAQDDGLDDASLRSYFHAQVTDILQEIDLMSGLRGNSHIVSFEDHKVIEKPGSIGWDILIRMELLTSLRDRMVEKPFLPAEVAKLGMDLCRALELCARQRIIHRDIKPENIFVSPHGDYKLGDFGIARQVERSMSGLSKKGTYTYMAPEVFKGEEYGSSVDTYSLGLVMYRLLNHNRTPFLPDYPSPIMPRDREEAQQRRMRGEPIPPPKKGSAALQTVVLRACAYDRKARFGSAAEMREALEEATGQVSAPAPADVQAYSAEVPRPAEEATEGTAGVFADVVRAEIAADGEHTSAATVGVFTASPRMSDSMPRSGTYLAPPAGMKSKKRKAPAVLAVLAIGTVILFVWLSDRPSEGVSTPPVGTAAVTRVPTQQPTLGFTPSPTPRPTSTPVQEIEIQGKKYSVAETSLSLSNHNLFNKDIQQLQYMTNLESLDLSKNQISDISALKHMENLKSLDLSENLISDISELMYMENLRSLDLYKNHVSDISALGELANLKWVDLGYNDVSDISALYTLANLTHLYVSGNQLNNISSLSKLTNLTGLRFSDHQISNLSVLSELTNLSYLSFNGNGLRDISALSNLKNLTHVILTNSQVSDISVLSKLPNLEYLYLMQNGISDISALRNLANLRYLNLSYNKVSDLSALSNLTNLTELLLYDNKISSVSALRNLTNLTRLSLFNNQISDVSALRNLTNLTDLNLLGNEIRDWSPVNHVPDVLGRPDYPRF